MHATVESTLATHKARLDGHDTQFTDVKKVQDHHGDKLDKILMWIIGIAGTAALSFLGVILNLLKH